MSRTPDHRNSTTPPSRRWAGWCLALGALIIVGVLLAEARALSRAGDVAATAPVVATSPAPSTVPLRSSVATAPAPESVATSWVDPAAPVPVGVPVGLELPRLGVRARVDPVGAIDGQLQVPDDASRLGWWSGGVVAGSPSGSTVVDGHIDTQDGPGAFYRLQDVEAEDLVVVTVAGGASVTYRVTDRRSYAKADGLPAEVFGHAAGSHRLVLISCGGRFDDDRAVYDDNVVVIAVPA